jgi:hypothetical protein
MKKHLLISIFCFLLLHISAFSQNMKYSAKEKTEIKIFNDFKDFVLQSILSNSDINDSAHLKYILSHYLFIDVKSDSLDILNNVKDEKLDNIRKTVNDFFDFLMRTKNKKNAANLTVIPSRLSPDKNIYNRFTSFQKNNSLVFYDKRTPDKMLGYILFLPVIKGISTITKIWSWTLGFKLGQYYFISATGEEGYEYLFGQNK